MARRAALALLLFAIIVAPAGANTIVDRKNSVDAKIDALGARVDEMQQREASIRAEVVGYSTQIRDLADRVGDVSARLGTLERDLALRRSRLQRLDAIYDLQTKRLRVLRRQHALAVRRLDDRLVQLYESDDPDTLSLLFTSKSISEVLDRVDYLQRIASGDHRIAHAVAAAKERMRVQRLETRATRKRHRQELRVVALRTAEARALRNRLVASRDALAGTKAAREQTLASLTAAERDQASEIDALQAVSAELAARIQAAQASSGSAGTGAPSAAGFIWPVVGPVTSPFGMRWGRMHDGIDIAASSGTPIHAAASGTVIYAGWMEGYGNLVVIDHGNGLSTAYGHQSSIAVGNGQAVAQGQTIGYVGTTGHSTGPHLHFEVRVNGAPVDPLGYL